MRENLTYKQAQTLRIKVQPACNSNKSGDDDDDELQAEFLQTCKINTTTTAIANNQTKSILNIQTPTTGLILCSTVFLQQCLTLFQSNFETVNLMLNPK